MELNRKKIMKALQCCGEGGCKDCPYVNEDVFDTSCIMNMAKDAIALIKELTRKLEIANLEIECKERICESYMLQYGTVADKEVWLKKERADTVRKMQEKLIKGAFCSACGIDYSHHIIQIAKEMMEGK